MQLVGGMLLISRLSYSLIWMSMRWREQEHKFRFRVRWQSLKCQIWWRTASMMRRRMSMVEVMKSGVLMMMPPVTKVGKVEMTMNLQLSMSLRWRRCGARKASSQ